MATEIAPPRSNSRKAVEQRIKANCTPDQKLMYRVLREIIDLFIQYEITDEHEIRLLLSARFRGLRPVIQLKIARRLKDTRKTAAFNETVFNPWYPNFRHPERDTVAALIDCRKFWAETPGQIYSLRGLLATIIERYEHL